MSSQKPETQTSNTLPEETAHLSTGEKAALEKSAEVEHAIGTKKEKLTQEAEAEANGPANQTEQNR